MNTLLRPSGDIALYLDRADKPMRLQFWKVGEGTAPTVGAKFRLEFEDDAAAAAALEISPESAGESFSLAWTLKPRKGATLYAWAVAEDAALHRIPLRVRVFARISSLRFSPRRIRLEMGSSIIPEIHAVSESAANEGAPARTSVALSLPPLPPNWLPAASDAAALDAYWEHYGFGYQLSRPAGAAASDLSVDRRTGRITTGFLPDGVASRSNLVSFEAQVARDAMEIEVLARRTEIPAFLVPGGDAADFANRRNILILSEGWGGDPADRARFEDAVARIGKAFYDERKFHPFDLLLHKINLWYVFEPAERRGITMSSPLKVDAANAAWKPVRTSENGAPDTSSALIYADREPSAFGLHMGGRLGDGVGEEDADRPASAKSAFHRIRHDARMVTADPRRCADSLRADESFDRIVGRIVGRKDKTDADRYPVGQRWMKGGADAGWICFLIDEEFHAGTQGSWGFAVGLQHGGAVTMRSPANALADPSRADRAKPSPIGPGMVDTFVHELGHVIGLGDEYSDDGQVTPNADELTEAEGRPNLTTRAKITGTSGDLDFAELPWARFLIPLKIRGDLVSLTADASILRQPEYQSWSPERRRSLRVLQVRNFEGSTEGWFVNFARDGSGGIPKGGAYRIAKALPPAGTSPVTTFHIELHPVGGTNYGDNYVMMQVKSEGDGPAFLVPSALVAKLNAKKRPFGPFVDAGKEQGVGSDDEFPDPDSVPRAQWTSSTVAAYEGGGGYPKLILRPAGQCKMRRSGTRGFCLVCQYYILAKIDVQKLAEWGSRL